MESWDEGSAYEVYIGRWSRPIAREFLAWLDRTSGGSWLDVGCGTGALIRTILEVAGPVAVTGLDASPGFIAHARRAIPDPRAVFQVGDAQALPFPDASFDCVVSALMLNFLPRPEAGTAEMVRVVRPGGMVATYLWDYAGGMQAIRRFWDAAIALDPAAGELDEARRFPLCQPEALARLFTRAGLHAVEVRAIETPTLFPNFEDFWSPFLGGQGPAPGYVAKLSLERRDALREYLRASLPADADGAIRLTARAWAVRGEKA